MAFLQAFLLFFALYIVNIIFLVKKDLIQKKRWKTIILILNVIALIFGIGFMYFMTVLLSMAGGAVLAYIVYFGSWVYFVLINIILTIFVVRKKN